MQSPSRSRRFFFWCLIFWSGFLALRLGLDWVLGAALTRVFSSGTGCEVRVQNPHLEFFPIRASTGRVSVRHSSEAPGYGFFAEQIKIELDFLPLLRGEIRLHDFQLLGARVASRGKETGFLNTLEFLFPSDSAVVSGPPGFWQRQFSKIVFHITDIHIPRYPSEVPQLRLDDITLSDLDLAFIEQDFDPKKPYDLTAWTQGGEFLIQEGKKLRLGKTELSGALGGGKFVIAQSRLNLLGEGLSKIEASGEMGLHKEGEYNIHIQGDVQKEPLSEILHGHTTFAPRKLIFQGTLGGKKKDPTFSGRSEVFLHGTTFNKLPQDCGFDYLTFGFLVSKAKISLSDIAVDGLLQGGSFAFFVDRQGIEAELPISFADSERAKQCISGVLKKGSTEPELLRSVEGRIWLHGQLVEPRRLEAGAELSLRGSKFRSNIAYSEEQLDFQIQESVHPALGGAPRLNGSGSYNLKSGKIDLKEVSARQLPVFSLIQIAAPFLKTQTLKSALNFISPEASIDASIHGAVNSSFSEVEGSGFLTMSGFRFQEAPLPPLRFVLESSSEKIHAALQKVKLFEAGSGGEIEADLIYLPITSSLRGLFKVDRLDLGRLFEETFPLRSELQIVSGQFGLEGSVKEPQLQATIAFPKANLHVDAKGTKEAVKATVRRERNDFELDAHIVRPFAPDSEFRVEGKIQNLALEDYIQSLPPDTKSLVNGGFEYIGPIRNLLRGKGSLELSELNVSSTGVALTSDGNLRLNMQNGRVELSRVELRVGDAPFRIVGTIDTVQGYAVDILGRWNLALVPHPEEVLQQLAGTLECEIQTRGALADPVFHGKMKIRDASAAVPFGDDVLGFSKISMDAQFEKNDFLLEKFEAVASTGKVAAQGSIRNFLKDENRRIEINAHISGLQGEPIENLSTVVSGDLLLSKVASLPLELAGKIHIDRASYESTIDLVQIVQSLSAYISGKARQNRAKGEARTDGQGILLNIQVDAENDLVVETNVIRAELATALKIQGDTQNPLLNGAVRVLGGEFGSESNKFTITSGRADFQAVRGTLDPDLSLVAETSVITATGQEQQVRMFLSGSVTAPKVEFVSEGGLNQEEIIALLGLRTNIQTVRLVRKDQERRSLVDLINPVSGATLRDRLSGITGFSEVQVDTALSGATGEVVPRLVAKRPIAGKITLDAVSELSGQQLSILNFSYPIHTFLNLIAGFRTIPPSGSQANSSGSLYIGLRHRSTFPGTSFLPKGLSSTQPRTRNGAENNFGLPR